MRKLQRHEGFYTALQIRLIFAYHRLSAKAASDILEMQKSRVQEWTYGKHLPSLESCLKIERCFVTDDILKNILENAGYRRKDRRIREKV